MTRRKKVLIAYTIGLALNVVALTIALSLSSTKWLATEQKSSANDLPALVQAQLITNSNVSPKAQDLSNLPIQLSTSQIDLGDFEVDLAWMTVDTGRNHVRILSPHSLPFKTRSERAKISGLTLDEFNGVVKLEMLHSLGFESSWAPPTALGYIKIDGQEINRAHNTWLTSGVFCTDGTKFVIGRYTSPEQFNVWPTCIQGGPLMIADGKVVLNHENVTWPVTGAPHEQSFLCSDENGKLVIGYADDGTLLNLANYLVTRHKEQAPVCKDGIALAGRIVAGMLVNLPDGSSKRWGSTSVPLPTALGIESEDATTPSR